MAAAPAALGHQSSMPHARGFDSLATSSPRASTKWTASVVSVLIMLATAALLPIARQPMPASPGFVAIYQTALVLVYLIATGLLFAQYVQNRSASLLIFACGSLYVTAMVLLQLLCFPNVIGPGLLLGQGPDTLTWLWTFWHIGPPLCAIAFALVDTPDRPVLVAARHVALVGWLAVLLMLAVIVGVSVLVTRYVQFLPKSVIGDDYSLLLGTGIGFVVEGLTIAALAVVCWRTRLRTVLQLWLAVSLLLLVLDNLLTDAGMSRGSIGWEAGRIEALLAGACILAVYLVELDVLRRGIERVAHGERQERERAQAARDQLALTLTAADMGGWEMDLRSGVTHRTGRFDQILGLADPTATWGRAELLAHVASEDRLRVESAFAAAAAPGAMAGLEVEFRISRGGQGEQRWVSMVGRASSDASGVPVSLAGCVLDTTERRRTEERLRSTARMEAVGKLTGGVAHDFNNLLTVISGSLELIAGATDDRELILQLADRALVAAQRGAEVTGNLLSFSRRQVLHREVLDLNAVVRQNVPLLTQAVGKGVRLVLDLDPRIPPVRIDRTQLEIALVNLATNARDALPDGGRVMIATAWVDCSAAMAEQFEVVAGGFVRLSMIDNGTGMDDATLRQVCEPFFTTKDIGKGTGLGLSQVLGFSRQEGGTTRIASVAGHGTTVEMLLPQDAVAAVAKPVSMPPVLPPVAEPLRVPEPVLQATGDDVVLVVDDDPEVLGLVVRLMRSMGFTTLTASSAADALEVLRGPGRVDVMFSDVMMPGGMNGVQLTLAARAIREDLKVVLTSGYGASVLDDSQTLPAGTPLLSKPYGRAKLASTLQSILHQRGD
jgi:signal transduction histidine kinase